MVGEDESPRRRDVLRTGAAAGLLGFAGLTMNGASAQETTPEQETTTPAQETTTPAGPQRVQDAFGFSLQEGDLFVVRFRPRDPFGEPATETVPAGCLDGEAAEFQVLIVRAFRGDRDLGYRGLLVPVRALAQDLLETTTAAETTPAMDETTTEAAMQDETTTPGDRQTTTPGDALPELERGEWYRATSSVQCDGLFRLTLETAERPETTPTGGVTTTPGGETTTE